ncbi:uncharacterized protein BYT42DRAFT_616942 [Radiomyces spectabilis]|uniref:uncharacterized protein n=1 Tax=Radiomyces spectabilis TaxID=64574 RepID=UPI00221FDE76|nr:uncharacterized protein BYT42DRAFT_616942 [Radiomyces spectabilis]KAI8370388.1 hypothetical protein BYT42DRAFT_616942 [Radiomyces spectabilis]
MSFDIEWSKLDKELAGHVQQFLNDHFQKITKPSFIGDIEVTSFEWGHETPTIEITNITDPFPEFYEEEDDDDVQEQSIKPPHDDTHSVPMSMPSSHPASTASEVDPDSASVSSRPPPLVLPLSQQQRFNLMHSFHRSPLVAPQHPFSSTPNYYFSPTSTSPTSGAAVSPRWMSRRPSTTYEEDMIDDDERLLMQANPAAPSVQSMQSQKETQMDFQAHLLISYTGDMSMTLLTELRMNYPSMMFMSLPIQLCVRRIEFEATAVVAYIQSMNRVCVSMLEPVNDGSGFRKDVGLESLLKDVHIESIVGDKQKQVLKNVGKIEKFIVDQLRKMLDDELVFPSYQCILMDH